MGDVRIALSHCDDDQKTEAADWKRMGASNEEIARRTEAFKKEHSPEARQKWLEIEQILAEVLRKE